MSSQLAQVHRFESETVWNDIQIFLKKKENKSENTRKSYENALKNFFIWLNGKRLEILLPGDLHIKNKDVIQYQNFLKEKGNKNSTVNARLGAIRSFYSFLGANEYDVNNDIFSDIDKYDEDEDSESAGELTLDEVQRMIDFLKNDPNKGLEKSLLIMLAVTTSFRKTSLLSLNWSNISYSEKENLYIISTYLKRKKDSKPITPEQYKQLLQIKKPNQEKIFTLSSATVQRMMDKLKKELNIDDSRNICFHSLKNLAIGFACGILKDMNAAQIQGNHKTMQTTKKFYIKANRRFGNMPGLKMWEKVEMSKLDKLNREELVKIIKEQCSEGCQREILSKIE